MSTRRSLVDYAATRMWVERRRSIRARTGNADDDLPSLLRVDADPADDGEHIPPSDLDAVSWDALFAEFERYQLATRPLPLRA